MVERIKSRGNSILALSSETTINLRTPEDWGVRGRGRLSFARSFSEGMVVIDVDGVR